MKYKLNKLMYLKRVNKKKMKKRFKKITIKAKHILIMNNIIFKIILGKKTRIA